MCCGPHGESAGAFPFRNYARKFERKGVQYVLVGISPFTDEIGLGEAFVNVPHRHACTVREILFSLFIGAIPNVL